MNLIRRTLMILFKNIRTSTHYEHHLVVDHQLLGRETVVLPPASLVHSFTGHLKTSGELVRPGLVLPQQEKYIACVYENIFLVICLYKSILDVTLCFYCKQLYSTLTAFFEICQNVFGVVYMRCQREREYV